MLEPNTKHFVVTKLLFEKEEYRKLSDGAKLTHGILHDYINIAIDNEQIDQDGIYIYITNKELGEILNKSPNTVIRIKKELEEVGLLIQKRSGLRKPNKLYVIESKE